MPLGACAHPQPLQERTLGSVAHTPQSVRSSRLASIDLRWAACQSWKVLPELAIHPMPGSKIGGKPEMNVERKPQTSSRTWWILLTIQSKLQRQLRRERELTWRADPDPNRCPTQT